MCYTNYLRFRRCVLYCILQFCGIVVCSCVWSLWHRCNSATLDHNEVVRNIYLCHAVSLTKAHFDMYQYKFTRTHAYVHICVYGKVCTCVNTCAYLDSEIVCMRRQQLRVTRVLTRPRPQKRPQTRQQNLIS